METNEELTRQIEGLKKWNRWFYSRVKFLRECQKEYFETRQPSALKKSKEVEREIDKEIERLDGLVKQRDEEKQLKLDFE